MGLISNDFLDFIKALNLYKVRYILVGGYAVVLRGYSRSTGDMDIWIEPTEANYYSMIRAFAHFGLPTNAFTLQAFVGTQMDVFSFGVEPQAIDIMTAVKGLSFTTTYNNATIQPYEDCEIRVIHIQQLLQAKQASGRHKDLNDIEHLKKIME